MGIRREARMAAVQTAFRCDFHNDWSAESVDFSLSHFEVPVSSRGFATTLVHGLAENLAAVDVAINNASENWSLSRMHRVDRSILRIAAYEILFVGEVPRKVAINEAIEIAKELAGPDAPNFINGILDRLQPQLSPEAQSQSLSKTHEIAS